MTQQRIDGQTLLASSLMTSGILGSACGHFDLVCVRKADTWPSGSQHQEANVGLHLIPFQVGGDAQYQPGGQDRT